VSGFPIPNTAAVLKGLPFVTASPVGSAAGYSTNNGAQFGPDTAGTTTSGLQEALTSLQGTGGELYLAVGVYNVTTPLTYTSNYPLTITGAARGRMEQGAGSGLSSPFGVFLLCTSISAATYALTVTPNNVNLGLFKMENVTLRGQAMSYTGSTPGTMYGINFNGTADSPSQVSLDNVAFEFMSNPLHIFNPGNGPIDIGLLEMVFCTASTGAYNDAMVHLNCATCDIKHIEAYSNIGDLLGFESGNSYCQCNVASIYSDGLPDVINFGCNTANVAATSVHIGQLYILNPATNLVRLTGASGNSAPLLEVAIDHMVWGASPYPPSNPGSGQLVLNTNGNNVAATVQVEIERFTGAINYVQNNVGGITIGSGSFLRMNNATLTAAPTADANKFTGFFWFIREVSSTNMLAAVTATAGSGTSGFSEYTSANKRFVVELSSAYTNAGAVTITYPFAFSNIPAIVHDDTGGATRTATTVVVPHVAAAAGVINWIIVEGY
jgi:hypothetical protein